jgi:hypothetical protein
VLRGHEDWSNLQYYFLESAGFSDGTHPDLPDDELTAELWQSMVGSTAVPGDYNGDGSVDAADYVVWRHSLGESVTPYTSADGNGNGLVDEDDYSVWRRNFGNTVSPGSGSGAAMVVMSQPASAAALIEPMDNSASSAPAQPAVRSMPLPLPRMTPDGSVRVSERFAEPGDTGDLSAQRQDQALLELLATTARDRAGADKDGNASPATPSSAPDDPSYVQTSALDAAFGTLGFLAI